MFRQSIKVAALAATVCILCQGCAALVAGYLIGDGIQRSRQSEQCHANVRTMNEVRLSKGMEPWPDQCSN